MTLTRRGETALMAAYAALLALLGFALFFSATELPPCPTEDSVSCYWDASKHGNGQGRSFVTDEHGNVRFTR